MKVIPNHTLYHSARRVQSSNSTLVLVESFAELKGLCLRHGSQDKNNWKQVLDCFPAIENGCSPDEAELINARARALADEILELDATLSFQHSWQNTEVSDVWCAGAIAEGLEQPCFMKKPNYHQPALGQGDGCYRLIINTDHYACTSPRQGAITMGAIIHVLSQLAPVDIWIQQGWLGYSPTDGVTLFPIAKGSLINPSTLWFWLGDHRKDGVFSHIVNRELFHRHSCGVSQMPAIPADIMLSSIHIGDDDFNSKQARDYVQRTCRTIFYPHGVHEFVEQCDS